MASLRDRKKAATRQGISDAATRLFVERGFDGVTVKEIADAADVSPTTVFKHYPTKEALVFDEDAEQQSRLVASGAGFFANVESSICTAERRCDCARGWTSKLR